MAITTKNGRTVTFIYRQIKSPSPELRWFAELLFKKPQHPLPVRRHESIEVIRISGIERRSIPVNTGCWRGCLDYSFRIFGPVHILSDVAVPFENDSRGRTPARR
jgi:hypothetical protein